MKKQTSPRQEHGKLRKRWKITWKEILAWLIAAVLLAFLIARMIYLMNHQWQ